MREFRGGTATFQARGLRIAGTGYNGSMPKPHYTRGHAEAGLNTKLPQIETWPRIPVAIRDHLAERMHDRNISLNDLDRLRVWLETRPNVPKGPWFKDFGSFKICGEGKYPKTFLLRGQPARGKRL